MRKTFFKVDIQLTYFSPTHIYDFGSIPGYYECIKASEGKGNKEFREWVGDWDPKHFDSSEGVFENPRKRFLETMFD